MRSLLIFLAFILLLTVMAGCVQPRYSNLDRDYYGAKSNPDKHWWGKEQQSSNVNLDRFIYKWDGLLK